MVVLSSLLFKMLLIFSKLVLVFKLALILFKVLIIKSIVLNSPLDLMALADQSPLD